MKVENGKIIEITEQELYRRYIDGEYYMALDFHEYKMRMEKAGAKKRKMTESEYRAKLKANHICRDCKQTDAYTLAGRTYCAECAEKMANRKKQKRSESREEYNAQMAEYRKKLIEENRCSRCGKKLSDGWKRKLCIECLTYSRRKAQESRREKGQKPWDMRCQDGVCFVCGAKSMDGKRMCKACYGKRVPISIENLKKAVDTGEIV